MRFLEVIKEAPISDIQPMVDPDPEIDQDFADPDEGIYKAWTEPEKRDWLSTSAKAQKWRAGVVKSWSKTKNNYLIIPVFGEDAYNYENLEKWWYAPDLQNTRKKFCHTYVRKSVKPFIDIKKIN